MNRPTLPRCVLAATTALVAVAVIPAAASAAAPATGTRVVGVVLSPSGAPVAGVQVGDLVQHAATSDANGRVVLTGVVSEVVCARVGQDQPLGGAAGWSPVCVDVADSGTSRVTLQLAFGAAVAGVVTDARTGGPVAGAHVTVSAPGTGRFEQAVYGAPTTDAHGRFHYRNLPVGLLQGPVARAGGAASRSSSAPYGYDGADQPLAGGNLLLKAGQVRDDLNFVVAPLVRYSGTVARGNGTAVANAFVAVRTSGDPRVVAVTAQRTYSVDLPWSGSARVCAWSRGSTAYPTGLAAVCTTDSRSTTTVNGPLTLGAVGGSLTGRVLTPEGSIAPPTVSTGLGTPELTLPGVVTDGAYRIDGVPAGVAQVTATVVGTNGDTTATSRGVTVRPGRVATVGDLTLHTGGV